MTLQISAVDLALLNAGKSIPLQGPPSTTPIPGILTSPVFENAKFYWAGDWSFGLKATYGQYAACVVQSPFGGWQPYAPGFGSPNWPGFSLSPFTKLHLKVRPYVDNWKGSVYYEAVGDKPIGNSADFAKYGTFAKLQWTVLEVPLADNAVSGGILKFCVQDQTGTVGGFDVDECGFI